VSHRSEPLLGFSPGVFATRRRRALSAIEGSALVLPAAELALKSADTERRYRADSELFYLTGMVEPGGLAVLRPGGENGDFVLFVQPRDDEAERWSGARLGPEGAREVFGADQVYDINEAEKRLPHLLAGTENVHFRLGSGSAVEKLVLETLATARSRGARKGKGPRGVIDPGAVLDPLRLLKDSEEVERMRRAVSVTVDAFQEMCAQVRPGVGEWELEAALDSGFRKRGAWGPAYPTIVGSGPNACILHYVANDRTLEDGDLVLVDAGAEYDLYAADITRTYPASGRFSAEQRAIYDVVLSANRRAVESVCPGITFADVHRVARDELIEGLLDLGVLEGGKELVLEEESYKPFFPHQTSHWLGLDVHDVGDYASGGESRVLEEGMVLTVEPGLYFTADAANPATIDYLNIGVRIEDDVLVTSDGHEVLTAGVPAAPEEIEALLGDQP
jgi:Xaa-Pro aminopeptidase